MQNCEKRYINKFESNSIFKTTLLKLDETEQSV